MSNNPFALDFTGLNEGLAALGAGLGRQNAQQREADTLAGFMQLLQPKQVPGSPMYTPEQAAAPRQEAGYPIPGGGDVSQNITPLLAMLRGEVAAPAVAPNDTRFMPGATVQRSPLEVMTRQNATMPTTTRPPTQDEIMSGVTGILAKDPLHGGQAFAQFLAARQGVQNLANAPEERTWTLAEREAKKREMEAKTAKDAAYVEYLKQKGTRGGNKGYFDSEGNFIPADEGVKTPFQLYMDSLPEDTSKEDAVKAWFKLNQKPQSDRTTGAERLKAARDAKDAQIKEANDATNTVMDKFTKDPAMKGRMLGSVEEGKGYKVYENGKLIGHYN